MFTDGAITAKSGIWRYGYRTDLVDAIIACREEQALEAAQQLSRLGVETLARDLHRVRDEVLKRLGPDVNVDLQLRCALMRTVMGAVTTNLEELFQADAWQLAPAA
jgi:hypothetical protein